MLKTYLILFISLITFQCFSQMSLDEVDYNKIPQKKIRYYINNQKRNHILKFNDLVPTCCTGQNISNYHQVVVKYFVRDKIDKVWEAYKSENPSEIWNGKIVSFGILYSMHNNSLMYRDGKYSGAEPGQVLYLNMKILKGIYNLALAFEIVTVDDLNKVIEFSYVDHGKAKGLQKIQMIETKEGFTNIIHSTYFKSNSKIRDTMLYPFFHKKAINEFHHNLKRKILGYNCLRHCIHHVETLYFIG